MILVFTYLPNLLFSTGCLSAYSVLNMSQFRAVAKNFSSSSAIQNAIKNVTIIGGGLMGSGIAQVYFNPLVTVLLPV